MIEECRVSYNENDDSLLISCRKENENIRDRFFLDDIVFYLTGSGKIVGLQIREASKFFEESDISPDLLDNLKSAGLTVIKRENSIFIKLNFIFANTQKSIPLGRIPLPQLALN